MHPSGALPFLFMLSTTFFHLTSSININVQSNSTYGEIRADGGTVDILNFDVVDDHDVQIEDNGIYPPCIKANSSNYGKATLHNPNVRLCSQNDDQPGPGNIHNDNPGNYPANPPCTYNSLDERQRIHYNQTIYGNFEAFVFDCVYSEHETNAIDSDDVFVWIICNSHDGWRGVTKFTYKNGQKGRYTIKIGDAYITPELICSAQIISGPTISTTMTPKTAMTSTTTTLPPFHTEKKPIENSQSSVSEGQRSTASTRTLTTTKIPLTEKKQIENGKFTAYEEDAPGVSTATIVGCSIGGIALFAIAAVVVS